MKELFITICETAEKICDDFCKFGGTGDNDNGCVWCQSHEGQCPFDDLMEGVKDAIE